jgi:hypothetical protein
MKHWKAQIGALAAISLVSVGVVAFPQSGEWHATATAQRPGGGDVYANGSTRDFGITCNHCHINDKNQQGHIDFIITPSPAWSKVNNLDAYKPGQLYAMTVTMAKAGQTTPGDNLGAAGNNNNINGFTLTVEDAGGNPKGTLRGDAVPNACPPNAPAPDATVPGKTTYTYNDCRTIVSLDQPQVILQWSFTWMAPAAGTGDLTVYYAAVDGDGKKTSYGDDVKVGNLKLKEGP